MSLLLLLFPERILSITEREFWEEFYSQLSNWALNNLPQILLSIVIFYTLLKGLHYLIKKTRKLALDRSAKKHSDTLDEDQKRINTLMNILRQTISIVVWAVFLMTLLKRFDIDIAPILASAGIIGLAVGFGAQELVRDFITGFFILFENQVRAGDVAIINGTGGLVEKIELRTITLRDFSGIVHIFQNGKINSLSNMTKEWSAMVFDIGVAYKENIDEVVNVIKTTADEMLEDPEFKDCFLEPMEIFGVERFASSSVDIRARFKTKPGKQWMVGRAFRGRLKKAFDQHRIEIPFPHTTVYWGDAINPLKLQMDAVQGLVNPDKPAATSAKPEDRNGR